MVLSPSEPASQYRASEAETRAAVAELLALGVPGGGSGNLVAFHLAPGSRFGIIGRRTELVCFSEAFGETARTLSDEYGPFESVSGFFVVIDTDTGMPAGCTRYVDGGVDLNPTLRDLEAIGTMPEVTAEVRALLESHPGTWDILTTEVLADYRGHHGGYRAIGLLGRMMVLASGLYQVPGMTLVAAEHAQRTQAYVGWPERMLSSEPLVYPDGLKFLPAWVDIPNATSSMLAHLESLRARADDPSVARELPTLEPLVLGMATGAELDQLIDMNPR